ncbi:UPF0481 protein At3g47200-like [Magnolia sinica]|uniref:UPF0481 protein At3g47200-like n=1 Tax=Magnolia sinica TaxID=86752 RepID=UPI00265AB169|nr:UPF0481 protein At3g47200-like [Magnolia sinica]
MAGSSLSGSSSSSSIQIMDLDPTWVSSLKEKMQAPPQLLKESAGSISCSIYRVPECFREADEKAYAPQTVSVGPYHRGKQMLEALQEHKYRYLRGVRSRAGDNGLERCLMAIKELEQRARDCYSENINLNSNEFVEMMVVDGCFILELLCKGFGLVDKTNDPLFTHCWLQRKLQSDLLRLENQIPFFVLERLFDLMNLSLQTKDPLTRIVLKFFHEMVPGRRSMTTVESSPNTSTNPNHKTQHLLHLFHSSLLPDIQGKKLKYKAQKTITPHSGPLKLFPSVTKLTEAGVVFKASHANSFLDIKFRQGVVEIPPLSMEDETNSLFLNLLVFEQCYSHCRSHITAYATFMDCLINSTEDVGILCHNGILANWLGGHEEVADLFNKLGREVTINCDNFYLSDVFENLDQYYRIPWHAWRASLMHKYFNNPWAIISFVGAVILLVLTSVQTFFTAYPCFHQP